MRRLTGPLKSRSCFTSVSQSITSCIACNNGTCSREEGHCTVVIQEDRFKKLITQHHADNYVKRVWYTPDKITTFNPKLMSALRSQSQDAFSMLDRKRSAETLHSMNSSVCNL